MGYKWTKEEEHAFDLDAMLAMSFPTGAQPTLTRASQRQSSSSTYCIPHDHLGSELLKQDEQGLADEAAADEATMSESLNAAHGHLKLHETPFGAISH
eukprot:6214364-Pleurochrysis_carterae.AAC.6